VSRRTAVRIGLALALVVAVMSAAFWWSRARLVEAGAEVVLVEGRDLNLTGTDEAGVGIAGTLGLVADRCVGFVSDGEGSVIVWPAGTSVSGSGEDLTITSEGETVRLGDQVEGGSLQRNDFPEFDGRLPAACRGFPLIDVGLNS
jgi:hypothetical protein